MVKQKIGLLSFLFFACFDVGTKFILLMFASTNTTVTLPYRSELKKSVTSGSGRKLDHPLKWY